MSARILVIDDEYHVRDSMRKYLETAGFEVVEAENGFEGLEQYHDAPADLVITDIEMPEKDGFETITELTDAYPDAKIIAMSGCIASAPHYLRAAKGLGAKSTLIKPVDKFRTLAAVRGLLGNSVFEQPDMMISDLVKAS